MNPHARPVTVQEALNAIGVTGGSAVAPLGSLVVSASVRRPSFTTTPTHAAPGQVRKATLWWLDGAGHQHQRDWFGYSANAISDAYHKASIESASARAGFLAGLALGIMMDGGR